MTEQAKAVSPGPWKYYTGSHGIWSEADVAICTLHGPQKLTNDDGRRDVNAAFIVSAANACFAINPEHPEKVAAEIELAFGILKALVKNAPDDPIAGGGVRVVDGIKKDAAALLAKLEDQGDQP